MNKEVLFSTPLNDFPLTVRAANAIISLGFETIGDVARLTPKEWLRVPRVGKVTVNQLDEELRRLGSFLGDNK